jgi:16S rRNA (cytidine1402-2'-O)-methyltransferase
VGYLPAEANARRAAIAELERQSSRHAETQIFIETPYRNEALLADLLQACRGSSRLAVAADLTGAGESIRMDRIDAWRARAEPIGKRPAIFLLQA